MNETAQDPNKGDQDASSKDTRVLARRVQIGDRASFQELYDRVAPALYAWTCLRIQGGPAAGLDPQEVLQETWLRGVRGVGSYDPAYSFRGWLLGITKNVLLQGYRKHSYDALRDSGSPAESQLGVLGCPDSVTSISTRLARDESIQHFLAYVGGLPSDDRMLVLYCGLEEYTCAEAATRLGLSPDAASKRWQNLRARMRQNGSLRALALEGIA
jgi:RNA polymerase sigma factor (sigma-70 family)